MKGKLLFVGVAVVLLFPLTGQAQNILPNPSFEVWLDTIGVNLPLGWLTSELAHPGSATRTAEARTGSFALELSSPDTAAYATTTTLVRAGAGYNFTAWVRTSSLAGGSFVISWLGMLGNPLGTPVLVPFYRSTEYREYGRRVTAPDSAFWCVVLAATLPGVTAEIDDVTLDTLVTGIRGRSAPVALHFQLYPAQPNPFYGYTVINYSVSVGSVVSLRVYDLVGNVVRTLTDDYRPAGFYNAIWNGTDDYGNRLSPGVYFCRLEVGDKTLTQKLIRVSD